MKDGETTEEQERMNELTVGVLHCNRLASEAIDAINGLIGRYSAFLSAFDGQNALQSRVGMAMRTLKAAGNHLENLRPRVYMIDRDAIGAAETAKRPLTQRLSSLKSKSFHPGQKVKATDLK